MASSAIFLRAPLRAGLYESFYLRAVSPVEPLGVWIRHTVHKRPGAQPRASVWLTLFDPQRGPPLMCKLTRDELHAPAGAWIEVGSEARIGPGRAEGSCCGARWSLRWRALAGELRHLRPRLLYSTPVPRTKLTSPVPAASFDGTVQRADGELVELRGWPGMIGHNWGSEHAERWIWVHGAGFERDPRAWLDVALGRVLLGNRLSPWVANGALSLDGRVHRIGGLAARTPGVAEGSRGCTLHLRGAGRMSLAVRARVPDDAAAGWRYADPDGGEHDVVNCSVARLELEVAGPGLGARSLRSAHGGAYELGLRERDHGVPLAPFEDG